MYSYGTTAANGTRAKKQDEYDFGGSTNYDAIFRSLANSGGGDSAGSPAASTMNTIGQYAGNPGGVGTNYYSGLAGNTQMENLQKQLPLQIDLEKAHLTADTQTGIAELNAKVTLATQMAQLEQARLQAEAERRTQLELQRRTQLGDSYGAEQKYYYEYGI